MLRVKFWLMDRLVEKSTWGGLFTAISTLLGISFMPDKAEAIATLGAFAASMVAIATKEG